MAVIDYHYRHSNCDIYGVRLNGDTVVVTVTATASVVKNWISATLFLRRRYLHRNRLVVGLGVQWTPTSVGGHPDPPAQTLQLCIGGRCLIYQLARAGTVPQILRDFLMSTCHHFVGFWNHSDRRRLEISGHRIGMYRDPLDLRQIAVSDDGQRRLKQASVYEIVGESLGFVVPPLLHSGEVSLSDWSKQFLSKDQVLYACLDAHCAFLVGKHYRVWNFQW